MSEHDWMPTDIKGVIGIKTEEYERLKADSGRLDKLNRFKVLLSLCGFDEFYFADVRAWIDELEEPHE